jgi:hypothetical protein
MRGERQCDSSGPGTHIEDIDRTIMGNAFEHGFDQVLGLRARNEGSRGHFESESEELLLAGDVLDGLAAEPALDDGLISGKLFRREHAIWMCEQGSAVDVKNVQQQQLRIALGVGAKSGINGNLVRSLSEGLT